MIDKNRLEQKCSTWNISLTGTQLDQLDAFAEILVEYNQKVNLTAITDPEGIEDKHFLDSLLFASQPEVAGKMVDVGAGAGFPGIVTKIYKPELELTLMEPTGKRVEFLKYACGQLGLTGGSPRSAPRKQPARSGGSSLIWPRPALWRRCPCWRSIVCRWSRSGAAFSP